MTPDGTQAIRRAIEILTRIAQATPARPATAQGLAAAVGLPRSTVHRMLKSLIDTGMVIQPSTGRGYEIGPLAFELGLAVRADTLDIAGLTDLTRAVSVRTGMNTYLMRRSGIEAVCLAVFDGAAPIRVTPVALGQRRFLGVGAGACALLAELDDATVEAIIREIAPALRDQPNFDAAYLAQSVRDARAAGYAVSDRRIFASMFGLGMAVPGRKGPSGFAVSIAAYAPDATPALRSTWAAVLRDEIAAYVLRRDAAVSSPSATAAR